MYVVNCDCSIEPYNPGGILAWAFIVKSVGGKQKGEVHRACGLSGKGPEATNNVGEYHAVIAALIWLIELPKDQRRAVVMQSDSQLVVNQCSGQWQVREPKLKELHGMVKSAQRKYGKTITFKWIPREKNTEVDALSRTAYDPDEVQMMRDRQIEDTFGDDDLSW